MTSDSRRSVGTIAHYDVLGYRFSLDSDLRGFTTRVGELLSGFSSTEAGSAARYETRRESQGALSWGLFRDGVLVQRAESEVSLLDFLLWDVNGHALRTTPLLALHAAAASWHAQGLVMPGKMNAGKTTLVAGLVESGFDYLSDEAALIDPSTGSLHPYPKPLWMEPPSVRLFNLARTGTGGASDVRNFHVHPERLRPGCIGQVCEVRYVVAPRYTPGARTTLQPVSAAEALMLLADNSFNLGRARGPGIRLLGEVLATASCYRLVVGDLSSAVSAIRGLVTEGARVQGSPRESRSASVA